MKDRRLLTVGFMFLGFAAIVVLPLEPSYSHPVGSNGWHLNSPLQARSNADVVCKVRVVGVQRDKTFYGGMVGADEVIERGIATVDVISVVKGECPDKIDIAFHYPRRISKIVTTMRRKYPRIADFAFPYPRNAKGGFAQFSWDFYSKLDKGEVALVFLEKGDGPYELGRIWSKARVTPQKVPYDLGETANMRLLAEFLAGCGSEDETVQLQAVEELGYLGVAIIEELVRIRSDKAAFQKTARGLIAAQRALAKMRNSKDPVINSAAFISSFQADDSPGIEGPLRLMRSDPNVFDANDSVEKYGVRSFSMPALQLRLLETMDSTTRRSVVDLKDGSSIRPANRRMGIYRGVRNFDYPKFYRLALDCPSVKQTPEMRRAIANVIWIRCEEGSVPEMVRLLDDSNTYARFVAVGALSKYTGKGPVRDGWEAFEQNDKQYIEYWKDWWLKNREDFEPSQAP